ncbi:hypothetical protein QZH41_006011 [Actinostola sp. cb2023]|nr:hypothetical protein QZH41_006011 [Actinostola sp. cb2023]
MDIEKAEGTEEQIPQELKVLAKAQGIKGYYKLRKAELIEALAAQGTTLTPQPSNINEPTPPPSNILDEPIPEIDVPILKPVPASGKAIKPLKMIAEKTASSVKKGVNEFADWILSHVPEPIKKVVNKRVDSLKEKVNRIFKRADQFNVFEQQTALNGYLKTHRIDGQAGYDPKTFISKINPKVINLVNQQKKPIKVKFILTYSLELDIKEIYNKFKFPKKVKMTPGNKRDYENTTHCHICEGELGEDKVLDHCHLTGKYRGEKLQLLLRKGVFPYDWFNGFDKLEATQLPPKEAFYSKLNDTDISEEDHQHAEKVWETFSMKTMREYHDLYLESDVLLLADVFENFRDACVKNYGLDSAWYYTAPGLAWDAALKLTEVKLELFTDPDMHLMIEEGIRGGVSMISKRHGKANNKYTKEYDSSLPTKYITYLDANNLYGWAMSKPLPTHNFKWMTEQELMGWQNHPCILEVDLEYPHNLHDLHNDYPLAPERLIIDKTEKLIPNLNNKTKYVIHHAALKQYENLGLKVTKIHRGITFKESEWLKPYIDLNTNLRTKATNDFEKDFFKLMNNSVFGKTMENIRNHVDIRLVTNEKDARKLISKPNYQHRTIFCENLTAIQMKKTKLVFNKPVYLGMSILDLSKTLMYDFHYNYIKSKYGERAKLLFTDTDSLMYEIETEDFYKDISPDVRSLFDTSNYPKDHPSCIETGVNKKIIGMFKDEVGGEQITEFVGLRAKLYSYKMAEKEEKR